jgi:hypothetical protein
LPGMNFTIFCIHYSCTACKVNRVMGLLVATPFQFI